MTTHGQQVGESATTGASAADAPNPDFGEAVRLALATMPAAQDLGVVVEALEPGEATLVLPVRESHTQHTGHVQAGVLGALIGLVIYLLTWIADALLQLERS